MSSLQRKKTRKMLAAGNPWDETQPSGQENQFQPQSNFAGKKYKKSRIRTANSSCLACLTTVFLLCLGLVVLGGVYLFFPFRTNLAVMGIDYSQTNDYMGRSDTLVLLTAKPFRPYVGVLSIPRDLWVAIPGFGENRINAAHFFAEAQNPGDGPKKVLETIHQNFGINVGFYLRFRFEDFTKVIDAMDGVDISLTEPMAGYEAGNHHLSGRKALAFARNRLGSDDFFRMERNQLIIKSAIKKIIHPVNWWRIPGVFAVIWNSVDTDIPIWLWPRLGFNLALVGPAGINFQTINRDMVTPFTTDQGANVLLPDWTSILPIVDEIFGQ